MIGSSNPVIAEHGGRSPRAWLPGFTETVVDLAGNQERPISAAWATSLIVSRLHNSHFIDLAERFHYENSGATPSEAQRRFLSSEQAVIFAAQEDGQFPFPHYPSEHYANPRVWPFVYRWIRTTHGYSNQYYENVVRRPLTTSVSQREVAGRVVRRFLSHIIGDEPLWASCGPGDMSGDRRNWLSDRDEQFRFDPVAVRSRSVIGGLAISDFKGDLFNSVVQEPDTTRRVVGLDRIDPTLTVNKAWTHACSTPEEIWSGKWDDLHDRIMRAYVPAEWLGFRLADFSRRADMRAVVGDEGVFDGASALFSWYQGPAEQRRRKLLNMRDVLVRPDGVTVLADFARVVGRGAFLSPEDIWKEPTVYVGYQGRLHPILSASNGRFREVEVLPALASLAKGGPHERTVRELLA